MATFEPRIPRDLAIRLGEEAVTISMTGEYVGPAGLVKIGPEVARAVQASVHYTADHAHPVPATGPHQTTYEVTNETTLAAEAKKAREEYDLQVKAIEAATAATSRSGCRAPSWPGRCGSASSPATPAARVSATSTSGVCRKR